MKHLLTAVTLSILTLNAMAAEVEVKQLNKEFSPKSLKIKVGDTINFKNEDGFAHNVFSLSDIKFFDLGSYNKGDAKKVVFNKPGSAEVECAIYPNMKLMVEVTR